MWGWTKILHHPQPFSLGMPTPYGFTLHQMAMVCFQRKMYTFSKSILDGFFGLERLKYK
jgi:hypothetical protein